jgi:hypothetical protein
MAFAWTGLAVIALYIAARLSMEARRHRRLRASRLRFTEPGLPRLSPGLTTIAGVVETDEPEGVAIRLCAPYESFALDPSGEPRWRIWAAEAERSFEVHAFTLVAGGGVRVRVQPDEDVNLLSWPESVSPKVASLAVRQHAIVLRAGERVLVSGVLACSSPSAGAYRGEEHAFVLHAPRGGSLVIEAEPFAVCRDRMPRTFRRIGDATFAAVALAHLGLLVTAPDPAVMFITVLLMLVIALAWASIGLDGGREPERP